MLRRTTTLYAAAAAVLLGLIAYAAPDGQDVVIVNGTRTAVIALHIKDSRIPVWPPEILDRRPLGVQKETVFRRFGGACLFDLKAKFEDGHRVFRERVDFCKTPRYVLSDF